MKNDIIFRQDDESKCLFIEYDKIWSVLESKFGLDYKEIKELTTGWLNEHTNLKGYTTNCRFNCEMNMLNEHTNLKGYTTSEQAW